MSAGTYIEWTPPAALRRYLACSWAVRFSDDGTAHVDHVLPDGCIDLLWTPGGLVIAGPDTTSAPIEPAPGARIVGVRFRPAIAPAFLGVPASALVDQRLDARDVLGARVGPLVDALHEAKTAHDAANVLVSLTMRWLSREPDAMVEHTIAGLQATVETTSVASVMTDLGVSERQLRRRFVDAVGYAPKRFHRITRLRRFVALAVERDRTLADLAIASGYADQAHLTRDVRDLAGCTPSALAGYPVTAG